MIRPALLAVVYLVARTAVAETLSFKSPDGHLAVAVTTDAGVLRYDVRRDDRPLIEPSRLGITIDGNDLGVAAALGPPVTRAGRDDYAVRGVRARATPAWNEAVVPVQSGKPNVSWELVMRVFDGGVAYRYRVSGSGTRRVAGEASEWRVPAESRVWFQQHNPKKDYEARFQTGAMSLVTGSLIAAPCLFKLPADDGYALLTEADLIHYSDMGLTPVTDTQFRAVMHNDAAGFDLDGDIVTPWRVTVLAKDLTALVNTTILRDLCPPPPPELANADWIKPGRATWHWLITGRPKYPEQHRWVDWTAELGFEYYLVDDGWNAWRAGDRDAWQLMRQTVEYAKSKNVGVVAWVDCKELTKPEDRLAYMQKARDTGLAGLKIDFMRPGNVEWVQWYDDTLRDAAKFQLIVDFHGALKPTGRDRTWPHELNREAVAGREQGKLPGLHDTTLPFVRYVQGAADYTPTELRGNLLHGNTVAKELAMAVVYTSPFLCYGGDPAGYLASPVADVIKSIPPTWDETIVLPGSEVGETAAFARRKGNAWYVGVINNDKPRKLSLPLLFLKEGPHQAVLLADKPDQPATFDRQDKAVSRTDTLELTLAKDGGYVARLTPLR